MEVYRTLGQSSPLAGALTTVYTATTNTVVSSVVVCNRDIGGASFRISIAVGGETDDAKQYYYYDLPIIGNDTFIATIGVGMGAGDEIRCYSSTANLSFNVTGVEVTT